MNESCSFGDGAGDVRRALPGAGAGEQNPLPQRLFRALRFVPPAVLTAIIVPGVLMPGGTLDRCGPTTACSSPGDHRRGGRVAHKNLLLTIVVGMAVFLGWRALFPA